MAFITPANPGATPVIPGGTTGPKILAMIHQHTADSNLFEGYFANNDALKQLVAGAINSMYLCTLSPRITCFANVPTLQMLVHLYSTYGCLSPSNLQADEGTFGRSDKENDQSNQPHPHLTTRTPLNTNGW
jgi:hypothetical protein